jgi:hypothetical protein
MKQGLSFLCWAMASFHCLAQAQVDVLAEIGLQRDQLTQERAQVSAVHDILARACWQKFAVNDCLATVRKSKRKQLDPVRQKELELNAQERAWRTLQRDERLQNKLQESGGSSEP